jgi:hypothetical protein
MKPTIQLSPSLYSYIKDLICTSRPYYALRNLQQLTDTILQCEILVENYGHKEDCLISAAEAGRHLAILGSCVLAANNQVEAKHFYLATAATLVRSADVALINPAQYGKPVRLICRAELIQVGKKSGSVATSIYTPDGLTIYELQVEYKVMTAELFAKLFSASRLDNTDWAPNPYTAPVPLKDLLYTDREFSASLGVIRKEQCVGHFDHYPALPVAVLSSSLMDLAGTHLRHITNNQALRYTPVHVNLQADRLAFAGEEVFIKSWLVEEGIGTYTFLATAENAAGSPIGQLEATFDLG